MPTKQEIPMQTYQQATEERRKSLEEAQQAVGRDLRAAIEKRGWAHQIRNKHDVEALLAVIDKEAKRDASFFEKLHAAADEDARQKLAAGKAGRGPGRPKKGESPAEKGATGEAAATS